MSGSNIKYKGREGNKRDKQTMTITFFQKLIVTYYITIDHTYPLLYNNPSISQLVTSNIEKETKRINKL